MLSFAIVIPNLNQSHFLRTALESLRQQSVPFELALMDGGSTDNLQAVIEPYSDIITFFRSQPDSGQADAIREGKDVVSGDIVAWLNADDYYFPGALDRVAAFFEQNPELDVVYGDAIHVSQNGFFLSYFPRIQEFNARDLTRSCFICQPSCFVRRSAYEALGGINSFLHYTMDWDLWCRLSEHGAKFCYFHEVLAAVRYYPTTKTLSGDWDRYREIWRIERKYGHRPLPLSWLGAYHYGLAFNKNTTVAEKIFFHVLSFLKAFKQRIHSTLHSPHSRYATNHGFHRWDSVVDEKCTIQLPWYEKQEWKNLYLKVDPVNCRYRIQINQRPFNYSITLQGRLMVRLAALKEINREISIENLDGKKWKFLGLSFDVG